MTTFARQREAFRTLRDSLSERAALRREVEEAISIVLSEYNTTIHENRFVAGGVCERIMGAAMRASGVAARNVGKNNPRYDLELADGVGLSVKGTFTGRRDDIRLINSLGDSETRDWREATLFVISKLGIAYGDPELIPRATKATHDALLLVRKKLDAFLERAPEWVARCEIAHKSGDVANTKVASEAVAREILSRPPFRTLREHL